MADFLRWALTLAILAALFGVLRAAGSAPARWADEHDRDSEAILFEHGVFVRVWCLWLIGLLPLLGSLVIVVMILIGGDEEPWVAPAFLGLAVFFLLTTWIVRREGQLRVVLDPAGLRQPTKGGERVVAWEDVRRVTFSWFWNAVMVHGESGVRIRASVFFRGFDLFVAMLRHHLPAELVGDALARADRFRGRQPERRGRASREAPDLPEDAEIRVREWGADERERRDAE